MRCREVAVVRAGWPSRPGAILVAVHVRHCLCSGYSVIAAAALMLAGRFKLW
jgi:hypothetical protein